MPKIIHPELLKFVVNDLTTGYDEVSGGFKSQERVFPLLLQMVEA